MPFTVLVFAYRRPDLSPAEFKTHYESKHVPLIRSIAGHDFPTAHVRRYIQRSAPNATSPTEVEDAVNAQTPAAVLVGTQADFGYDALGELIFDDEAAFQAFSAKVNQGEAAEKIAEDEENFLDRPKTRVVVVSDCTVTNGS